MFSQRTNYPVASSLIAPFNNNMISPYATLGNINNPLVQQQALAQSLTPMVGQIRDAYTIAPYSTLGNAFSNPLVQQQLQQVQVQQQIQALLATLATNPVLAQTLLATNPVLAQALLATHPVLAQTLLSGNVCGAGAFGSVNPYVSAIGGAQASWPFQGISGYAGRGIFSNQDWMCGAYPGIAGRGCF
jgi:hypothetical protein